MLNENGHRESLLQETGTQNDGNSLSGLAFLPEAGQAFIGPSVMVEDGAVIHPMVFLRGNTKICRGAVVYPFCDLTDTVVGENSDIRATFSAGAVIGKNTTVGPFACLRRGTVIGDNCRVGDFVEIKNSSLADGVKAAHLAYIGDSSVGEGTNVGCGVVFANYNGKSKSGVKVGSGAFIGCNTNLVAPLTVGDGAYIAAGSTVTEDVPPQSLCIARSRQVIKPTLPKLN